MMSFVARGDGIPQGCPELSSDWTYYIPDRAGAALEERRRLYEHAGLRAWSPGRGPAPCRLVIADLNRESLPVLARGLSASRRVVLDWGDVPSALSAQAGRRRMSRYMAQIEARLPWMVSAFVFRGRAHALLHEYLYRGVPTVHVPDTVADSVLEAHVGDWNAALVSSFGTVTGIRDRWPAFYGAEVLDLVAADPQLTGVLVVRGEPPCIGPYHRRLCWISSARPDS
jgi:hypothetical protein